MGSNRKNAGDLNHGPGKESPMTAFLIVHYDVTDPDQLAQYRKAATPALLDEGRGTLLAADGAVRVLEGDGRTHTVVLQFDSMSAAQAAYESAEYQQTIPQRQAATQGGVALLVAGVDEPNP